MAYSNESVAKKTPSHKIAAHMWHEASPPTEMSRVVFLALYVYCYKAVYELDEAILNQEKSLLKTKTECSFTKKILCKEELKRMSKGTSESPKTPGEPPKILEKVPKLSTIRSPEPMTSFHVTQRARSHFRLRMRNTTFLYSVLEYSRMSLH